MYIAPGQGSYSPTLDKVLMSTETTSIVLPFSIQKHKGPKQANSTQGHHLNKLGSIRAPDAAYQVSRSLAFWLRFLQYMGLVAILVM